ncbi:pantoate--beta-alanine ligase [Methyloprofundus sp.]|uniref:pantoate--beta-alanine ligase n=1 Tax=Methyloprofundus sp. TaxID=2020875 RepID=UPI003D113916
MKCIKTIKQLRAQIMHWRLARESIAFVPTMGNLHEGHLQLVRAAKGQADKVVVSIFVNPAQFDEQDDFSNYPRTQEADIAKLQSVGIDMIFLPSPEQIYPEKMLTTVSVSQVTENYCGAARPGHFDGVATVVCKLFNMVQPDKAFFGEKDYQQLLVIRTMVADLNSPVEIISVPTFREVDGLAMSSRNTHLSQEQRQQAGQLYQALCQAKQALFSQYNSYAEIEETCRQKLLGQGFKPDYFSICRRSDLQTATEKDTHLIILTAARLGTTRLIDNIQVDLSC